MLISHQKESTAYLSSIKSSPLKVMKLTRNLVKMPVSQALVVLKFCNLKVSLPIKQLIYSAMSNAENNHNMDADNLIIKRIDVGRAFVLKRFSARARGKSSKVLKTFSKIKVVLTEKQN